MSEGDTSAIDSLRTTIDGMWVLWSCTLLFVMQIGFAFFESGHDRRKNLHATLFKNVVDFCLGLIGYWLLGHFIQYRTWVPENTTMLLHMLYFGLFSTSTATIIGGSVIGRMDIRSYALFSVAIAGIIEPFLARWVWHDEGFLSDPASFPFLIDFAGGGVVHVCAGVSSMLAAIMVGPRRERYSRDSNGKRLLLPIRKQSVMSSTMGMLLLWFGWFGFTCGSTLGITGNKFSVVPRVFAHTLVTPAISGATVAVVCAIRRESAWLWHIMTGILGGLVAITPACATVPLWGSWVVGILSGVVVFYLTILFPKIGVDDVVDAVPVHAGCGTLGLVLTGLLSTADLVHETYGAKIEEYSMGSQVASQFLGAVILITFTALCGALILCLLKLTIGLRVQQDWEIAGLDFSYRLGLNPVTLMDHLRIRLHKHRSASLGGSSHFLDSDKPPEVLQIIDPTDERNGESGFEGVETAIEVSKPLFEVDHSTRSKNSKISPEKGTTVDVDMKLAD